MRVVSELRQRFAQSGKRCRDGLRVGREIAGKREQMRRVPRAANEVDVDIALLDMPGLANLAAVHPHEIGLFGGEVDRVALARAQRAIGDRDELVEIALHWVDDPHACGCRRCAAP